MLKYNPRLWNEDLDGPAVSEVSGFVSPGGRRGGSGWGWEDIGRTPFRNLESVSSAHRFAYCETWGRVKGELPLAKGG